MGNCTVLANETVDLASEIGEQGALKRLGF